MGVQEINGQKVEDFVQVRDKHFFTDEEWLKMQNPVDAKPGDKVAAPRLQFYVNNTHGTNPNGTRTV
jgi:hypothetical protein